MFQNIFINNLKMIISFLSLFNSLSYFWQLAIYVVLVSFLFYFFIKIKNV